MQWMENEAYNDEQWMMIISNERYLTPRLAGLPRAGMHKVMSGTAGSGVVYIHSYWYLYPVGSCRVLQYPVEENFPSSSVIGTKILKLKKWSKKYGKEWCCQLSTYFSFNTFALSFSITHSSIFKIQTIQLYFSLE